MSKYHIQSESLDLYLINALEHMIFSQARVSESRLLDIKQKQALLLVAYIEKEPIGFKLGYLVSEKGKFFSWLGGVHPDHRRQGIAQKLLNRQEDYVKKLGIESIYFTTFDRFHAMRKFGEKNGYKLIHSAPDEGEIKYWYEKQLFR